MCPLAPLRVRFASQNRPVCSAVCIVYKKDESCAEITNVDTVVIAIGVRANTALEESLTNCDFTIVSVGDCHERAKNGYRGIQEGYKAGILI